MKLNNELNRNTGTMRRSRTLRNDRKMLGNAARLHELKEQLSAAEIDVLCCQGIQRTFDGRQDPAREIAESLRMTYFFSATDYSMSTGGGGKEMIVRGLSILAKTNVWMPKSSSFSLAGKDTDQKLVVQFAVIRKNYNSVLVINAEFSPDIAVQLQQLRAVFSHQHLQEHYGAVILCSNRHLAVSKRDLQAAIALSTYKLANNSKAMAPGGNISAITVLTCELNSTGQSIAGAIYTLVARNLAPATVKFNGASAAFLLDSLKTSGVKAKRLRAGKKKFSNPPLTYSVPWTDARDCMPSYVLSAHQDRESRG